MNEDQAVEPWRAAWMAFREAAGFDYADDRPPDDELDAQWIAAWKAAAQAATDAATEGSLRACGYTLADIGRFLEAEVAAQEPRGAPELAALREQVRLARQDRDQLRGQVLSLAADLEESAARTAPSKKTDIENATAARLRKIAEPPA